MKVDEIKITAEMQAFTVQAYEFTENAERVLQIGFKPYDLINRRVYVWVKPGPALRALHVRELRTHLGFLADLTVFANIGTADRSACRFAEFFGFTPTAAQGSLTLYERSF